MPALRTRRWFCTLNNPDKIEDDLRKAFLDRFSKPGADKRIKRAQVCREVGEKTGTEHWHFFVHFKNAKTRSALDEWTGFHWDDSQKANGTDFECWNYVAKDDDILLTHGEIPKEEGDAGVWESIIEMVKDGARNSEIIEKFPGAALRCQSGIDRYRLELDRMAATWRGVHVTFVTGPTGCGKTRGVCEKYGYNNVFRITDKKNMWETYDRQDVVVFEEFRGGIGIEDMLNYLDGHPLELPARYANKLAHYTKVYILTNIEFEDLYIGVQSKYPETWDAFRRRVHKIENLYRKSLSSIEDYQ